MTDVRDIVLVDETPEADVLDQHIAVDPDDETGLDADHVAAAADRDANPADLIDQAIVVPNPVDD